MVLPRVIGGIDANSPAFVTGALPMVCVAPSTTTADAPALSAMVVLPPTMMEPPGVSVCPAMINAGLVGSAVNVSVPIVITAAGSGAGETAAGGNSLVLLPT